MKEKEDEYKQLFMGEGLEQHEALNNLLTELEKNPEEGSIVDEIFRITHTLKGNASGMGFSDIASLAHTLEDLFGAIKHGEFKLNNKIFEAVFKALDVMGNQLSSLKDNKKVSFRGIKTKIDVLIRESKNNCESKEESKRKDNSSKQPAEENQAVINDPSTDLDDAQSFLDQDEFIITDKSLPEEKEVEVRKIDPEINKVTFSDLVQVPVGKLDNLLNLVGELIIERDRITTSLVGTEGANNNEFSRLKRISSDLQYSVMNVRLVQVGFLFNKFKRVVRDASISENKNVDLQIEGESTEIDRNILQIISDSLIHLIRNSISHGIEQPEERQAAGKSQRGIINLRSYNDNDGVIIEIEDDGKGIDIEKVKLKALSKGLVTKEMLSLMNDNEVVMLIFEPGFSTSDNVSSLSGRGVGMDVVKKATDSIGGQINIDTTKGKGTLITLKLPSSMAVKGTLLFQLGDQEYAIPLSYTEAVVSYSKSDLYKISNGIVASHLGKTISVVFLKDLFETGGTLRQRIFNSYSELQKDDKIDIIIVTYNGRTIGMVVDKLLQQKEIIEKPLSKPLDNVDFISGVTILGNGNVCPVLNISTITNSIFNMSLSNQ
ncbi:chemotaxis protein CheA [Mangrovivirga sp. M17]|uniref:Chemotaxis protein CheA n=1 Tax=Mangrovivirga halotolerans TaxID=2993936 RepID=A0ABT3RNM2_9BACT|nr:chemotaxis protein CheA [Mangrovivirga halotolerans]MCX2743205.1 chemotaxis protein CheA [Mangrovivirga halotolerans]